MAKKKRRKPPTLAQADIKLDMTPMIDVVFLLIIFFILAGRITSEISNEAITVPPTKSAVPIETPPGWSRIKVEVYGETQRRGPDFTPVMNIEMGFEKWTGRGYEGESAFAAYRGFREALNKLYDQSDKYEDPKSKMMLPKVILELRADQDTEYRIIQEIQQIATDGNDPANNLLPVKRPQPKPFVYFHFTTRKPGE